MLTRSALLIAVCSFCTLIAARPASAGDGGAESAVHSRADMIAAQDEPGGPGHDKDARDGHDADANDAWDHDMTTGPGGSSFGGSGISGSGVSSGSGATGPGTAGGANAGSGVHVQSGSGVGSSDDSRAQHTTVGVQSVQGGQRDDDGGQPATATLVPPPEVTPGTLVPPWNSYRSN